MMQKNDYDWDFRFGDFELRDNYTLEVGYTRHFKDLYLRLWRGDKFYVGATLKFFDGINEGSLSDDIIAIKFRDLPIEIQVACITCARRIKNLQAFS